MNNLKIENIKVIRKEKGLSREDVAKLLGIELQTYGKIERGAIKLTVERLYELADILGTSPNMILNHHKQEQENSASLSSKANWNVVYVPVQAQAGRLSEIDKTTLKEYYHVPGLSGNDNVMIDVEGDSMFPTISNGDKVIIKQLESSTIRGGEIYVVDTVDGMAIKRVFENQEDKNLIELHSDNGFFHPYTISKDSILSIWHLKECITKNLSPKNLNQ